MAIHLATCLHLSCIYGGEEAVAVRCGSVWTLPRPPCVNVIDDVPLAFIHTLANYAVGNFRLVKVSAISCPVNPFLPHENTDVVKST